MKKREALLAAVVLMFMTGIADAVDRGDRPPERFLGGWCRDLGAKDDAPMRRCKDTEQITILPNGYENGEIGCVLVYGRLGKAGDYRAQYWCKAEENKPYTETRRFSLVDKKLMFQVVRDFMSADEASVRGKKFVEEITSWAKGLAEGLSDTAGAFVDDVWTGVKVDQKKEARLKSLIKETQVKLRSQDVTDAAAGRGPMQLDKIIRAMKTGLTGDDLLGTSWDPTELHRRYPVQVTYLGDFKGIVPAYGNTSRSAYAVETDESGYSNGFYFDRGDRLVVNKHTLQSIAREKSRLEAGGLDIGVMQFAGRRAADEQVIHDSNLTDKDIDGELVVVVGIDPDETADRRGHKTLPSIAKRLTPAMGNALFDHSTVEDSQKWMEHGPNLFIMVLPPGESRVSAQGMSGSPVFMKGKLAGIFVATSSVNVDDRTSRALLSPTLIKQMKVAEVSVIDIAYFHGIDGIRKALGDPNDSLTAQSLPPDFRGIWCGPPDGKGPHFRPRGRSCPASSGDDVRNVTADGYTIEENRCKATNIVSSPDRLRLIIKFSCTWNTFRENWHLVDKKLWLKVEHEQ